MRGSSLVFLAFLAAFGQDGGSDAELRRLLKDLAGPGTLDAALKGFDSMPVSRLEKIDRLAAAETPDIRALARRHLPPSTWRFTPEKTIGDARKAMAGLLAEFAQPKRGKRDPNVLAAKQLVYRANPSIVPDVLKIFLEQDGSLQEMPARLLMIFGSEDLSPAFAEALSSDENRSRYALDALLKLGDARAEKALLLKLSQKPDESSRIIEALSLLGGDESLAEIRKIGADPATPAYLRNAVIEARLRMRDPLLPKDLLGAAEGNISASRFLARALARMGDESVLPDLVKVLESPKADVHEQIALLQVIGLLGNRDHTALLVKCLDDARLTGAAAEALAEIGDPAASRPLAEALKTAAMGGGYARALMMVPLGEIENEVLAILNDPDSHRMTFSHTLALAARIRGPKIKDRLFALLMAPGRHSYDDFEVARALVPMLEAKDSRKLSRSSSPDAPREEGETASARLAARAALGHKESRTQFVTGLVKMGGSIRGRDSNGMDVDHPLLKYPGKPEDLIADVRAAFAANPTWVAGAQFLAKWGHLEGLELLKSEAAAKRLYWKGVLPELPGSVVWKLNSEDWMKEASDFDLERIARDMPESAAQPLAESVYEESTNVMAQAEDQTAHARAGPRNKAGSNSLDLGAGMRIGLFAAKDDLSFENLYRWQLRVRANDESPGFSVWQSACALAKSKAVDMKPTFLKMIRSSSSLKRALGCHCLGLLGDRESIGPLVGLLKDHERLAEVPRRHDFISVDGRLAPRVCDAAGDAIENLAGTKFPSDRPERMAAIKAWFERTGGK